MMHNRKKKASNPKWMNFFTFLERLETLFIKYDEWLCGRCWCREER